MNREKEDVLEMARTNIMIVGGFLGAGKTTAMISAAKYLKQQGKRVGIITNGHSTSIVDTEYLKYQGFEVLPVTGACLGCNFNQFNERLIEYTKKAEYDYILVEPVGSCTDLVATIMKPIRHGRVANCKIMPLSIVVDPLRLLSEVISIDRHLTRDSEYLMLKQIEEADLIIVNRMDILTKADIQRLDSFFRIKYSMKQVIYISARRNYGINVWMEEVERISMHYKNFARSSLKLNYDVYARAEAELTWLSLSTSVTMQKRISGNYFVMAIAESIKKSLKTESCEIAHMKVYMETSFSICKLSCVSLYRDNIMDWKLKTQIDSGKLIINIRVDMGVEKLKEIVNSTIDGVLVDFHGTQEEKIVECFAPEYPKPSFRYT